MKHSIKRVKSQAGLSFAERKNVRPSVKQKLLFLLVLLMTAATNTWATDGIECSASDIGKVLCTDGSIYATVSDATAASKTAAAMIVYIDEVNNKGLALALADESSKMSWNYAGSSDGAADHKPAVSGGTWKLASQDEWNQMINAVGGYAALRDGFSSVGGDNLKTDDSYWSSTQEDIYSGKAYRFASGEWSWRGKDTDLYVRACLTFDVVEPTPTYAVTFKDGTEDAENWTVPAEAAEGATVTATYGGTRKVKSVTAVKKAAKPAAAEGHALTAAVVGELVCSDGKAYAAADKDNLPEGVTAVAMVAYMGSETDHTTYKHGLALALADESGTMNWQPAKTACNTTKNTNTPVTDATWVLPSKNQWNKMIEACQNVLGTKNNYWDLRDAFSTRGGTNLQQNYYWSSTEKDSTYAWIYSFGGQGWSQNGGKTSLSVYVRACLAF